MISYFMVLVGPEGGYAMDFRPIVAPSIRELFIQQLEGAILSGS